MNGFELNGVVVELLVYHTKMNIYYIQKTTGNIPLKRQGQSIQLYYDTLYMVGGCDYSIDSCYNDCYILNLNTFYWQKLSSTLVSFQPRQFPLLFLIDQYLILINGCKLYANCFQDIHRMNTNHICNDNNCGPNSLNCTNNICICKQSFVNLDCSVKLTCQNYCHN